MQQKKVLRHNSTSAEVATVYACITGFIVADQLLAPFVLSTVVRIIELFCLVLIAWSGFKMLKSGALVSYRGWALALIILLAFNNLFIVARGNYAGGLKDLVLGKFSAGGVPTYLLPFIILFLPNKKYFSTILTVLFYSMLLILPIWFIKALDLVQDEYYAEAIGAYLPFFGIVLLQFRGRFKVRQQVIMISIYLVYLLLMIMNARRNMVVSLTLYFILALFVSNFSQLKHSIRARIIIILGIAGIILFTSLSWGNLSATVFNRILNRGFEDTRSDVEMLMIMDFSSSPATDWLIGRGMDGTYFQMMQDQNTYEFTTDRNVIETGYLNMILKGGLLFVMIVLLFLITAFFRGISFKKPYLTGLSFALLLYLLDMYMTTPVSSFSVRNVVFWLIVSICFQYESRPYLRK